MAGTSGRDVPTTLEIWWTQLPKDEQRELKADYRALLAAVREPQLKDLRWWHTVGTALRKLSESSRSRVGQGRSLIDLVAAKLATGPAPESKSDVTRLYRLRKFADVYPDRRQVEKLAKLVDSQKIRPQHVAFLVEVEDGINSRTRDQFLADCLAGGWSTTRLHREIKSDKRRLTKHGGRPAHVSPTASPAVAARKLANLARQWIALHYQFFEVKGGPLSKVPRKADVHLLYELEAALDGLKKVGQRANEGAAILDPMVREIRGQVESGLQSSRSSKSVSHA